MPRQQTDAQFVGKFFKTEAKGKDWLSRLLPKLQPLSEELISEYSAGPGLNARDRKAFVRNYANQKAVGNPWLTLLLPLLIPILQRLLEAFLNREGS